MKLVTKILAAALSLMLMFGMFTGCGGGRNDIEFDDDGNIKPSDKVSVVNFRGWGDAEEKSVFDNLVTAFNKKHEGVIRVDYTHMPSDGYATSIATALLTSNPPDVVYAGDGEYKLLVHDGSLLDLTDFINKSEIINEEDMWDSALNRYRYDADTTTNTDINGNPAKIWGVPKDIGPTVIYYNASHFKQAGITIISVPEDEIAAKIEADEKIPGTTKTYSYRGYDAAQKVFNNRIAMSWDEVVTLSRLIQDEKIADYGYFTEWWFAYGWSVGGDCIQYIPSNDPAYNGGYWDFTLADETKNYIVADDYEGTFTVNGNNYTAGQIIDYLDKFSDIANKTINPVITNAVASRALNELPSQREAFTEFVRLSQNRNTTVDTVNGVPLNGYGITPNPTTISTDGKVGYFTSQKMSMLVDGRWTVVNIRKDMPEGVEWDVAPLPIYKTYNDDGTVAVHGIASGHSGSTAMAIAKNSRVPQAAWMFVEYACGPEGQGIQAEAGFAIPNQKTVANSEQFLQSDRMPYNSIVFIEAAENQTPGDWWYLKDKEWINEWAGLLNGDVRNGLKTLTQFYASNEYNKTFNQLKIYTSKNS